MSGFEQNLSNFESQDICGPNGVPYFNERKEDISGDNLGVIERNLDIPEGIRFHISKITSETSQSQLELKASILDNFIRSSILVSSGNELFDNYIYNEIFAWLQVGLIESKGTLEDIEFPNYILSSIFTNALTIFIIERPNDFQNYINSNTHEVMFGATNYDIKGLVRFVVSENIIPNKEIEDTSLDISPENILNQYNLRFYTHEQAMEILEGEDGFLASKNNGYTYGDALEQFGFGESLQGDINTIFGRELNETETGNLLAMIRYFLYVESSGGYNVSNYEGVSTAKGYFQYLTGNGKYLREIRVNGAWGRGGDWESHHEESNQVRRVWGSNSYETALGHIPPSILTSRAVFRTEINKRGNQNIQNPMDLSSEEQTILFLSDLMQRPGATTLIQRMLQGEINAVEDLYRSHHTATDENTEFRMLLAKREIYGIEIKVYERDNISVTGLILPGDNITNFFMSLIKEFNPGTGLSSTDIMSSLDALGNFSFQVGKKIKISRSIEKGYAYELKLYGKPYMRINEDGEFFLR